MISLRMTAGACAMFLGLNPRLGSQPSDPVHNAAVAAVRAVISKAPMTHAVMVPGAGGSASMAQAVAVAVGIPSRGLDEGATCGLGASRCRWRPTADTVAVAVRPRTITPDRVVLTVEQWGLVPTRGGKRGPDAFYERSIVVVARSQNGWAVVSTVLDFAT